MTVQTTPTLHEQSAITPDLSNLIKVGDDLLMDSARTTKTAKVSGRITTFQSHQARAWTTSGQVD